MKKLGCLFICLIIVFQFGTCIYNETTRDSENIILSAYHDGVINGAEIYFFDNGTMQYENTSLIGMNLYPGTYTIVNDTFFVEYTESKPSLDFPKMVIKENDLIFLNHDNTDSYRFNLISNQ